MRKTKTHKKPRVGSGNMKSPGAKKVAKKQSKRATRRDGKTETLKEAADIAKFIMAISSKKYALANKYLQGIVEDKVKSRISSSLNEPLF